MVIKILTLKCEIQPIIDKIYGIDGKVEYRILCKDATCIHGGNCDINSCIR